MIEAKILTKVQFQFSGLSHIQRATEAKPVHNLYLLTDKNRQSKKPKVNARVKDPAQFLGVMSGFFAMLGKGLIYQPSSEHPRLSQISSILASRRSMHPIGFYSKLYAFMEDELEPRKAAMDPVLTVREGVCYLEAFDKGINRNVVLRLNPNLWEEGGTFEDGTAAINMTPYFIDSLQEINVKYPIHVNIGTSVGDETQNENWKGEVQKNFALDLEDVRALLIIQSSSALGTHPVDLVRVDIFNVLRTLRMHKAKNHSSFSEKDLDDIVFHLIPGEAPYMEIQPWGIEIPCQAQSHTGKRMEINVGRKRRSMLPLSPLLPYINMASFTLFENDLHYCLDIGNDDFQCSMVFAGFTSKVWYRRLQMETMLPGFAQRDSDDAFKVLDESGVHVLSGEETLREKKVLISEIMRGDAAFFPVEQTFVARSLFGKTLDMNKLKELGSQDSMAREYVANNRVSMKANYMRDGKLNFDGSTVTEPLRDGETEPFIAEPRFDLSPDGLLRRVGCTCTAFKQVGEHGFGGPCEHLRALWLVYCEQIEALREAKDAGEDVGPSLEEEVCLFKTREERIVRLDVRQKFILTERWKRGDMKSYRQTTQVYSSEASVRRAFENRRTHLEQRGFTTTP